MGMLYTIGILSSVSLVILSILYSLLGYNMYFQNRLIEMLTDTAANKSKKDENELYGRRYYVKREKLREVRVNIYQPVSEEKTPVIFIAHPGKFIDGDIDDIDSFCEELKNRWNVAIVCINYTKIDVHKSTYPQQEIKDVVIYFRQNCEEFNIDKSRFLLMGFEAGGYLALIAGVNLLSEGIVPRGYIIMNPYIDYVQISFARAGIHPGPMTVIATGKDTFKCEEYIYELDRAGILTYSKIYQDQTGDFLFHDDERKEEALQWIKENVDYFLK